MAGRGYGGATVVSGGVRELVLTWVGFPLLGARLGAALRRRALRPSLMKKMTRPIAA